MPTASFNLQYFPVVPGAGEINFEDRYRPGHYAIDIRASLGMTIIATKMGQVVNQCILSGRSIPGAGYGSHGGNYVMLVDFDGLCFHYYAHMQYPAAVRPGQTVFPGQRIGLVGETGHSPGGPHLHYQVWDQFEYPRTQSEQETWRREYDTRVFTRRFDTSLNPYQALKSLALALGARQVKWDHYVIPPV
jgi:murein DD-endopeptidase MepM/ murein hydrolase activator NlpD